MNERKRKAGAICSAQLLACAATVSIAAGGGVVEIEPNNVVTEAIETGLVNVGTVVVSGATLGDAPWNQLDRDLFVFDVTAEAAFPLLLTVVLEVESDEFDGFIRLFDEGGLQWSNSQMTDRIGRPPTIEAYLTVPGRVYVGVSRPIYYDANEPIEPPSSGRSATPYELTIDVVEVPPPVNSIELADDAAIVVDELPVTFVDQFIGDGVFPDADFDSYEFPFDAPCIIKAVVTPTHLKLLQPIVNRYHDEAVIEAGNAIRTEFVLRRFSPGACVAGVGFYQIHREDRRNLTKGYYDVTFDAWPIEIDGSEDGPFEPNDSLLEAEPLPVTTRGGVIATIGDGAFHDRRGDVDFFNIDIAMDEFLDVTVAPTVLPKAGADDGFIPNVLLYDYLGAIVAHGTPSEDGSISLSYSGACAVQESGIHFATHTIAVMGAYDRPTMDPFFPRLIIQTPPREYFFSKYAYDGGGGSTGEYELLYSVTPESARPRANNRPSRVLVPTPPTRRDLQTIVAGVPSDHYFATTQDGASQTVVEILPETGDFVATVPAPNETVGSGRAIATDVDDLIVLGTGNRFPELDRIDPDTGDVLDSVTTWFGSGNYGGIVALADRVFVVDMLEHAIYSIAADFRGPAERMDLDPDVVPSLHGAISATLGQPRLLVTDGDDPSTIHYVRLADGEVIASVSLSDTCTCDADFDHDGDVDYFDAAFFEQCRVDSSVVGPWTECVAADLDCDHAVTDADKEIFDCLLGGANQPPNEGCCPDVPATVPVRATGIATLAGHRILTSDFAIPVLRESDRFGNELHTVSTVQPVGHLAGVAIAVGDYDDDLDTDLRDFAAFQMCFWGGGINVDETCRVFDVDFDADLDLTDFAAFLQALTGVQ